MVGWLFGRMVGRLVAWLVCWWIGRLLGCIVLGDCLVSRFGWLVG